MDFFLLFPSLTPLLSVVSLLIVNIDDLPASEFGAVFEDAGLNTLSYTPSAANLTQSEWPTLGSMIDNGTRLVTFMDEKADFSTVPYIIDGQLAKSPDDLLLILSQSLQTSGKQPMMLRIRPSTAMLTVLAVTLRRRCT